MVESPSFEINPPEQANGTEETNIDEHLKEDFDRIISYSKNMTKSLFCNRAHSTTDALNARDQRATKRKEAFKRIKARDLYGDLCEKLVKSSHPLVRTRPSEPIQLNTSSLLSQKAISSTTNNERPPNELSIVLRDTNKTVAQTRLESAAKSARALVLPWMNSIDKKNAAMEEIVKPEWHPPWKLYRMISGHGGWVHSLTVDPSNMWFASGCRDGLIMIWDLAEGKRKLTLTGHISGVRGLAVSERHPYLFSCGDDKMVKCWDLERNQVVRHYHGHSSGVYCLAIHPTENILVTGGRDSVARVWDMRSKEQIHCLTGHKVTVGAVQCQETDPQLITGSYDTTIRLWDLKMGKTLTTLTNHKKSVRALAFKYDRSAFASGATDNIKQWSLPDGKFVQNLSGHNSIVNCLAANKYNTLVSGADNGTLFFWDWRTGYNFQRLSSPAQSGSIESEAGILAMTFDRSGARLITGESDKSIKMFREDVNATEDTHPIDWKPDLIKRSHF